MGDQYGGMCYKEKCLVALTIHTLSSFQVNMLLAIIHDLFLILQKTDPIPSMVPGTVSLLQR